MYEITNRLQKIANECRFSLLNGKIAQLKQINWNSLNNNILYDKDVFQRLNDSFRNSLVHQLNDFEWIFDDMVLSMRGVLQTEFKNMSDNMDFFNANLENSLKSCSKIINSYVLSQDFMDSLKNLRKSLDRIENLQFDLLFLGIAYNKEDLVKKVEEISIDLQNHLQCENIDGVDPKVQIDKYVTNFRKEHPRLYTIFVFCNIVLTFMGYAEMFSNFVPKIENGIVYFQGNSDFYFVKEDCAKIYEDASSQTNVIDFIYYGEEVIKLEDAKLWIKILCKGKSGNPVIGWVAKRNLMSYKDYKFNSDELYNID